MNLSRTRIAMSCAVGLSLAMVVVAMATLLDVQSDPALAQSGDLRAHFTPPSSTDDPIASLRTPKRVPKPIVVQLASPPVTQPAATPPPTVEASAAATATAAAPAPSTPVAQPQHGEDQEPGDAGEQGGGDD